MTTPTFDPNTATLEQCCDYIAECKYGDGPYVSENGRVMRWIERVPPTLDSIAGSLPEGWHWSFVGYYPPDEAPSVADKWMCDVNNGSLTFWAEADTEPLARARCSALAWQTAKEGKQ